MSTLETELARLCADNLTAHKMVCAAGLERDRLRAEVERLRDDKDTLEGFKHMFINTHTQRRLAEFENAGLLSALKLMVFKFDVFIDSEYCGTDLLAEQLAQADFAREVIRKAEDVPFRV